MKMKLLNILFFGFCLLAFGCKKDSASTANATNYLILNGDKRNLGTIPNDSITVDNGGSGNRNQWQLSLGIKTACYKIAGLYNDEFEIYINIWDKDLLKSEYELVPGYSAGGSSIGPKGTASIGMRPFKIGGSGLTFLDAMSGKIMITKDNSGYLKSVEFNNISLSNLNSQSFTCSARFVLQ